MVSLTILLAACIPSSDPAPVPTTASDLSSLEVSAGQLAPPFEGATSNYTVTVGNGIASTMVTATTFEPGATLQINNQPAQSGQPFGPIALNVGQNPIPVVVTPKGSAPKSYTITIIRSANVNLSSLVFSAGPLSPGFASDTVNYTVSAPNSAAQTTITPTAEQAGSTITIGGAQVTSGQVFGPVPLNVGSNNFVIQVRGVDTITTKTYTVQVIRAASSNATLSDLQVFSLSLSPAFSPTTTCYVVSNAGLFTQAILVTAIVSDPTASLFVNGQATGSGQPVTVLILQRDPTPTSIPVEVRAQDTVTAMSYVLHVYHLADPTPGTCP
ncbi:hypothetical protein YTPLAS18_33400 [Nitrospira sp.]|nr:hypothetical protein YTPLAS18_33400 [Nitrospira sp.]